MRLACPNCGAEYEVPDTLLATGPRLLRCARCGHQFQAALPAQVAPAPPAVPAAPAPPPEATPLPPPAPEPGPEAEPLAARFAPAPPAEEDRPRPTRGLSRHSPIDAPMVPAEPEPPRSRGAVLLGWLLTAAVLAAAGWGLVQYQAEVVAAWPPAARAYLALGLR